MQKMRMQRGSQVRREALLMKRWSTRAAISEVSILAVTSQPRIVILLSGPEMAPASVGNAPSALYLVMEC